jgi:hypothetical protein
MHMGGRRREHRVTRELLVLALVLHVGTIRCCSLAPRVLLRSDVCVLQSVPASVKLQPRSRPNVWRDYWLIPNAEAPLLASRQRPKGKAALRCLVRPLAGKATADSPRSSPIGTSLLMSDDLVNIWEFRLRPGESCAFHTHTYPVVFTNLAASEAVELGEAGARVSEARRQVEGQTVFVPRDALGSHGVLNAGETPFLQFIVELKQIWNSVQHAVSTCIG